VVATNGIGYAAAASTTLATLTPQSAPSLLSATLNGTATAAASNATLTWSHTVDVNKPFTGYQVLNNGVPVVATISGTTATVRVTAGTNYSFTVVAISGVAAAQPTAPVMQALASNALPVTDVVQTAPTLAVPTFLASAGGGTQAVLSWTEAPNASTYAVKGYSVYQSFNGGAYNLVGSTPATATTFTATMPTISSNGYNFRVTAFNDAGPSLASNIIPVVNQVPTAPTQTAVTAVSATGATLHWTPATPVANAPAVTGFQVQESINGVAQVPNLVVNDPTATSLAVTFNAGSTYAFKVLAQNATGNSALSTNTQTVTSTAPNAVATPTLRTVARNAPLLTSTLDTVQIRWTAPAVLLNGPAVTSYVVEYSSDNFATVTASQTYSLATLPAAGSGTNTTFNAVDRGTASSPATNSAYFRVRAINSVGTTTGTVLTVAPPALL